MKRFPLFSLAGLLLSWLIFLPPAFSQSNTTETLTISTYYPSPYGVYSEMRLYPKADATCNPEQIGLMYYDNTPGEEGLKVCAGSPLGWQSLGGYWTLLGSNLYPTNPTWKVGIGTTSPQSALHVQYPAGSLPGILVESNGDSPRIGFVDTSLGAVTAAPAWYIDNHVVGGVDRFRIFRQPNITTAGTEFVTVTNSGNVGIGTMSPGEELHVKGSTSTDDDGKTEIVIESNLNKDAELELWSNGIKRWIMQYDGDGSINTGSLFFWDSIAATPRLIIDDVTGNVGIGTTTPGGKLDVNGTIYQRGSLLHADYVFEPNYSLESIEEHSQYMWQNKHLKAVPKAQKDESGQDMVEYGARNRGILEELEKAHVYIQQLNDRIKALEKEK